MKVARSALGYRSTKAARDVPVLARMVALSAQYRATATTASGSFSDGHAMSPGRAYRLWRRARLQLTLVGGVLSALHASCA
jgi:putative transposase